ncbi:uncharacterized protein TNCV_2171221 [Trichonephila clavipes]|nr:uncharacterized protein TNCV_2171221 [Trichonephila clavipes]
MLYMYAEIHYMYGRANGNGTVVLRMYHTLFPDRRMPDHRIFQWLHRHIRETRLFYARRHDAGRRRAVRSSSLEEGIWNVVPDRSESCTRAVAHHVSMGHQTVYSVKRKLLMPFPFSASTSFESDRFSSPPQLLLLGGTAMCAAAGLHSSCAKQLL